MNEPTEEEADAVHNYLRKMDEADDFQNRRRAMLTRPRDDAIINRLNCNAGYDVFGAMATKSPERVQWEQEYLARRKAQTRPLYEVQMGKSCPSPKYEQGSG